jgi:hypothetical protein
MSQHKRRREAEREGSSTEIRREDGNLMMEDFL